MIPPDTCPLCEHVHGQIDPAWACPEHGHRLHLDMSQPGRDIYACPVWKCPTRKRAGLPEDVPQVAGLLNEDMPAIMRAGRSGRPPRSSPAGRPA